MSRAYLRFDPGFFERKALIQQYPAGVFVALMGSVCLAEHQPERGRFRSERLLRALLETYGRHVPDLIRRGDLIVLPDGRLYVDGWDEWQEGDWKVGERVARIRTRPRTNGVTVGVTPDVTVPVTTDRLSVIDSGRPQAVSGEPKAVAQASRPPDGRMTRIGDVIETLPLSGNQDDAYGVSEDEHRVFAFLARNGAVIRPDTGLGRRLLGLLERRGVEDVLRQAGVLARGERLSDRQWVLGLENALEAVPGGRETKAAERADEEAEALRRRLERTRAATAAEREALAARQGKPA